MHPLPSLTAAAQGAAVTPMSNAVVGSGGNVVVAAVVPGAPVVVVAAVVAVVVDDEVSSPHAAATRASTLRRLAHMSHRFFIHSSWSGLKEPGPGGQVRNTIGSFGYGAGKRTGSRPGENPARPGKK